MHDTTGFIDVVGGFISRGTSDCCDTGMGNGIERESI